MNKQLLVNNLLGLMNGTISKEDLKPRHYSILIGWGEIDGIDRSLYMVDGVAVTKDVWDKINPHLLVDDFKVSYGGRENG